MSPSLSHSSLLKPRVRPPYRAARAFYLTLLIGTCFATYAILTSTTVYSRSELYQPLTLLKRDEFRATANEEEQCRLVHHAKDQCAWVKNECPTDEGGFAAYLDLYFCRLPHAKPFVFIVLISWLGLLFSTIGIAASDFFCINLSTISTILGMSESMAGVTFLAFGNGSPDVFSTFAAMNTNSGSLAVGELFGAAGFITAVVAGSMALIRPFQVARKSFLRDVGFFVVAAAFSMGFLWDGRLHLWECLAMVAYYVFYVAFVVVWHWWLGRRRRRKEKEAAVRGHFTTNEELDMQEEEYRDDPDEEEARPFASRGVSREDWSALERGDEANEEEQDEDEAEHARDRWMSELNSNMRLTRPPARTRKSTLVAVRPSLVGALEFQAVLKSLQKSRNLQTYPMNTRRFSDDPIYTTAQQQDLMSTASDPASRPIYEITAHEDQSPTMERPNLTVPASAPGRNRAVSANDAHSLQIDPDLQLVNRSRSRSPEQENLIDLSDQDVQLGRKRSDTLKVPASGRVPQVLSLDTSPNTSQHLSPTLTASPVAVPQSERPRSRQASSSYFLSSSERKIGTSQDATTPLPNTKHLPKIIIPGRERPRSRPLTPKHSPFPRFHDDPSPSGSRAPSLHLPGPASPESLPDSQSAEHEAPKRPTLLSRWWPYSYLPPPGLIIRTLFPTIYHWHEKNYWEKALGVVAAPSVFLLTITLPVVESGKDDENKAAQDSSWDSSLSKKADTGSTPLDRGASKTTSNEDILNDPAIHMNEEGQSNTASQGVANVAASAERHRHHYGESNRSAQRTSVHLDNHSLDSSPKDRPGPDVEAPPLWNRWLLIVQLFLSPPFILFAIYTQSPSDLTLIWLLKPILIGLGTSIILLIPLILFTTPTTKPPAFRPLLSLIGFVVSIAWISTIAAQVVGALKALAVILNMSHAIMGLTIFAVGNSLGDLVADVTVARLGYPVMALSACFGGPMLNILLGIGVSGSYILIAGERRRAHKHPEKEPKFHSYHIDVSTTLIVSGATLLVTLLGLLVAVPMNRWIFGKRIGWALIALWTLSTIGNVVVEVTGKGAES